ncbi:MAG: LysE family translocator [Verrucomicrobiae bacterium]|nr:LysE family translocator [Verrucomicrobiae bacterium]NNJ87685.1 LysE family translocator [Akkermansiaceae bacterium]
MPEWTNEWLIFVGVMALGQFSPGPDMLLLTRTALASGRKSGCWTAIGIAFGLALHAIIAVTGVAAVLSQGGLLLIALKWVAAAYLTYLAVQLIRSGLKQGRLNVSRGSGIDASAVASWKRGLFCNLLNPKVAVFLAGVTAPFLLIKDAPPAWPVMLWVTIVFEGMILWCLWVFVLQARAFRESYLKAAHWFDLAFGIALLGVAAFLVIKH